MINPALLGNCTDDFDSESNKQEKQSKKNSTMQPVDRYQEKMRQQRTNIEAKMRKPVQLSSEASRIDVNAKLMKLDEARKKLLLEFFIAHFIKMAKKSNFFRNLGQSTLFLLHCENLLK